MLAASPAPGGRLCVLGAGKCNDLDLERLASHYAELHLVDIEPAAIAAAVSRQAPATRSKLFPHAPVDLAVLNEKRAGKWKRRAPAASELSSAESAARGAALSRLPGPFDTVVSACVLTQLGFALTRLLGERHALLGPLRLSTVQTHLRLLLELTARGGTSLFVSDLASSTHYPLEQLPPGADLEHVLQDIVSKRVFYHVAHPDLIRGSLAELSPDQEPTPLSPWLWTGPQQRTYLVYALALRRS